MLCSEIYEYTIDCQMTCMCVCIFIDQFSCLFSTSYSSSFTFTLSPSLSSLHLSSYPFSPTLPPPPPMTPPRSLLDSSHLPTLILPCLLLLVPFPQSLHRSIKEQRSKELVVKDKVEFLRHELEEVKEKKKISISERNKIRKG